MIFDHHDRPFSKRYRGAFQLILLVALLALVGCTSEGLVVEHADTGSGESQNNGGSTSPTNGEQEPLDAGDLSDDVGPSTPDSGPDPDPPQPDAGGIVDEDTGSEPQPDVGGEPEPQPDVGGEPEPQPDVGGEDPDDGPDVGEPDCTYGVDPGCPLDCTFAEQWDDQWLAMAESVRTVVNQRRAQGANCGGQTFGPADPLPMHEALERASRCHSQDMQTNDFMTTQGTDGSNGGDRAFAAGYPVGMVMSMVHGSPETPQAVVDSWMSAAANCEVLMDPDWEHFGAAVATQGGNQHSPHWTVKVGLTFE